LAIEVQKKPEPSPVPASIWAISLGPISARLPERSAVPS
jgi:hypothetical protein